LQKSIHCAVYENEKLARPSVLKSIAVKCAMIYIIILSHALPIQYTKCCGQGGHQTAEIRIRIRDRTRTSTPPPKKCPPLSLPASSACQRVDFGLSVPRHTCHVRHLAAITWPAVRQFASLLFYRPKNPTFHFSAFQSPPFRHPIFN